MRKVSLLVLAFSLFGVSPASADSFRCGNFLAREGRPASEIAEKCGEPDAVRTLEEPIIVRRADGTTFQNGVTITHYWYYERGPNQFVARVTIREDSAEIIDLLSARLLESLDLD